MGRREYGQVCSLARALDQIGERWSMLIVRELLLGPLRFSELARNVGGAPTDVLTKRLRDFEEAGIIRRRELPPPTSATVYELTDLGRELERPMLEMGRWGLHFQDPAEIRDLAPTSLPNAVRVIMRPPLEFKLTLGLRSGGDDYALRFADGWIEARRASIADAELVLTGTPWEILGTVVVGDDAPEGAEVEGDLEALEQLRAMVSLPDELREGAMAEAASLAT